MVKLYLGEWEEDREMRSRASQDTTQSLTIK